MLAPVVMMGAGEVGSGAGPSGTPSNGSFYTYAGGAKVGIQWKNGDATAQTEIAFATTREVFDSYPAEGEPIDAATVPAGWTSWDSGSPVSGFDYTYYGLRHVKNGQYSTWYVVEP